MSKVKIDHKLNTFLQNKKVLGNPSFSLATVAEAFEEGKAIGSSPSQLKVKAKPTQIKKGDVFSGAGVNGKPRPFVVAKVVDNWCYCIALTTTEDEYALLPYTSRFYPVKGYLTSSLLIAKNEQVVEKFMGVLDDNRSINKAFKIICEKYKKDLNL